MRAGAIEEVDGTMTDQQWKSLWVKIGGSLYLLAIILTMVNPAWRMTCVGLVSLCLGWFLTASYYAHKSQRDYFFRAQWWTPEELERHQTSDPEMLARAFPKG